MTTLWLKRTSQTLYELRQHGCNRNRPLLYGLWHAGLISAPEYRHLQAQDEFPQRVFAIILDRAIQIDPLLKMSKPEPLPENVRWLEARGRSRTGAQ